MTDTIPRGRESELAYRELGPVTPIEHVQHVGTHPEAEVAARVPALFKCNVHLLVADASLRLERIVAAEIPRWPVVAVARIARRVTGSRQLPATLLDPRSATCRVGPECDSKTLSRGSPEQHKKKKK